MAGALIQRSFQNIIQKYPNINKIETNYLKILIWITMKLTKPALNFTKKKQKNQPLKPLQKEMKIVKKKNTGKNGGKGIKKSKKSTNEPDTNQAFDDDDDLDVDYQEVDKAEKQYYDFEKFLKAEQELAMARMKFAEKRMR